MRHYPATETSLSLGLLNPSILYVAVLLALFIVGLCFGGLCHTFTRAARETV